MILYKYKSLINLWHILDIAINQRVYCAHWKELNDPLEGKYEIFLGEKSEELKSTIESKVETQRDALRIASFSTDPTNFLLWSHYADGHKGCAIELEIDDDDHRLQKVYYSPFSIVIQSQAETEMNMFHLFNSKNEEWEYESEYRIITKETFYVLDQSISRILLGPLVDESKESLLRRALPSIEIIKTKLDKIQGILEIVSPNKTNAADAKSRAAD
jgi:hypothetical protein